MKSLSFTLVFCLISFFIKGQTTNIPDANFEQALINLGIDNNGLNGNILNTDAQAVTSLTLTGNGIANISGINAFVNLTSLNLGTHDIANIILTSLTQLTSLETLRNESLVNLDLSQNILLEDLVLTGEYIGSNFAPIITIDLSQNLNLITLSIDHLRLVTDLILPVTNTLTEINVRYLADISLDFSLLDGLEDLTIGGSSANGVVITLPNEFTVLKNLKISSIDIPTIDISDYINLETLYLWGTYVENLLLPNSTTLVDIFITLHDIQNTLDLSILPNLTDLDITSNDITPLVIDVTQNLLLKNVVLSWNDMNSIDLTKNVLLEELRITNNNLTSLDLTQNVLLHRLNARNNQLPAIDLTQNVVLRYLDLSFNLLPDLDITQNIELSSVSINNNLFSGTGLDLTQNIVLSYLSASNNQIESLDISQNINLFFLILDHNLFPGTAILDQFYVLKANNNRIPTGRLIVSYNLLSGNIPNFASLIEPHVGVRPIGFYFAFDNNYFEFGHFENEHAAYALYDTTFGPPPYWNSISNINDYFYAPQAKVNSIENINVDIGQSITLTTTVAGAQNHYKWFKDGVEIVGAPDAPIYTISSINACDAGVYHSEITSDLVPFENASPPGTGNKNLLLIRNDITLNINPFTEICTNLANPINGAVDVPINETLDWINTAGACGYYINIGTTPGGNDVLNNEYIEDATSYTFPGNLPSNTQLYVTITPNFLSGTALTCAEESFTTSAILTAPNCAELIYPNDGQIDVAANTTLVWNEISNATGYTLNVGTSLGGNDIINNLDVGNVTDFNPISDLPNNTTIFVSITAYNGAGNASGCLAYSFTTIESNVVDCSIAGSTFMDTIQLVDCDINNVGFTYDSLLTVSSCDSVIVYNTILAESFLDTISITDCDIGNAGFTYDSLLTANNCDSVIVYNTIFTGNITDTILLMDCDINNVGFSYDSLLNTNNCDSITVFNTIFAESFMDTILLTDCDMSNVGFTYDSLLTDNNCDSITVFNTIFAESYMDTILLTDCDMSNVGFTYDSLLTANNCDSIIIFNTIFAESFMDTILLTDCDMSNVGFTYDSLLTANNCDSITVFNTIFAKSYMDTILLTDCDMSNVGFTYDSLLTTKNCDSITVFNTIFAESFIDTILLTDCDMSNVGFIYDSLLTANNCDSITVFNTVLLASYLDTISVEFCNGETFQLPSGDITSIPGFYESEFLSYYNCDSIIVTELIANKDSCEIDCKLFCPTAFTPNGDNTNDEFKVLSNCDEDIYDFEMSIYNRWGESIFYSNDFNKGWNGTLNGKTLAIDSYTFLITYRFESQEIVNRSGSVVLMR